MNCHKSNAVEKFIITCIKVKEWEIKLPKFSLYRCRLNDWALMEDGREFQAAKARENEEMFKGVIFSERNLKPNSARWMVEGEF